MAKIDRRSTQGIKRTKSLPTVDKKAQDIEKAQKIISDTVNARESAKEAIRLIREEEIPALNVSNQSIRDYHASTLRFVKQLARAFKKIKKKASKKASK